MNSMRLTLLWLRVEKAVSAEDAQAIIGISGYAGISSDIDIADDAASLISANDAVLNASGVDYIRVDGGIGEGGYGVNAADGAVLTSFSAEIDFDVIDTAQAIAAEVTGTDIRDGSSNSASDLDDAGAYFHYRWFCQCRRCKRYSEYFRI